MRGFGKKDDKRWKRRRRRTERKEREGQKGALVPPAARLQVSANCGAALVCDSACEREVFTLNQPWL